MEVEITGSIFDLHEKTPDTIQIDTAKICLGDRWYHTSSEARLKANGELKKDDAKPELAAVKKTDMIQRKKRQPMILTFNHFHVFNFLTKYIHILL